MINNYQQQLGLSLLSYLLYVAIGYFVPDRFLGLNSVSLTWFDGPLNNDGIWYFEHLSKSKQMMIKERILDLVLISTRLKIKLNEWF